MNDSRKPYQEGMVFRCDLDGSNLETLGWNFRNNWEVTVDSFGSLWQSDNDDDGNRGVRINFVMEYGNYGFKDEMTGASWQTPRTNIETEIPLRHWHLNDPGVMPNLLQTGGGAPTGICIYEGTLLPKTFQNQIIHCDAGPNVVRAYPAKPAGARLHRRDGQHPVRRSGQLVPAVGRLRGAGRFADRLRLVRPGGRGTPHGRRGQGADLPRRSAENALQESEVRLHDRRRARSKAAQEPEHGKPRYLAWQAAPQDGARTPNRR